MVGWARPDKDAALFGPTGVALTLLQTAFGQHGRDSVAPQNIRAGIEGISQDVADQALTVNLPDGLRRLDLNNSPRRAFDSWPA